MDDQGPNMFSLAAKPPMCCLKILAANHSQFVGRITKLGWIRGVLDIILEFGGLTERFPTWEIHPPVEFFFRPIIKFPQFFSLTGNLSSNLRLPPPGVTARTGCIPPTIGGGGNFQLPFFGGGTFSTGVLTHHHSYFGRKCSLRYIRRVLELR